jgi:predicted site-specific integrase-resolvase
MKAKEVLKILNITRPTLSKYIKEGTIKTMSTHKGRHIYDDDSVYAFIGLKNKKTERINVIYARTSNPPKKYLDEQEQRIINYCTCNGIIISKSFTDIKSGMNFNRDGLNQLIELIVKGEIELIIIENKDRLCRFGFELFEIFCKFYKTKILVINNLSEKSYEQELTEDLISIIHYFSMKNYSHRRKLNKIKKQLEENDLDEND